MIITPNIIKSDTRILRANELENDTQLLIRKFIEVIIYQGYNSELIVETMKQYGDNNKLFYDSGSPYLTQYGNQKKTEFVLYCLIYAINWRIECKSEVKYNQSMICRVYDELDYVSKIHEDKLFLVLGGAFNCKVVYQTLSTKIREKGLENKVWYGDLKMFEKVLLKQILF